MFPLLNKLSRILQTPRDFLILCFNCGQPGHCVSDCQKAKIRKKDVDENTETSRVKAILPIEKSNSHTSYKNTKIKL